MLLQGNVRRDMMFRGIGADGAQHGHRATGENHVRLQPVLPNRIHHIALGPGAAVLGGHIDCAVFLQVFFQEETGIPVAYDDALLRVQPLSQLQDGGHADAAAHEEGFFPGSLLQGEAVAQVPQQGYGIPLAVV